MLVDCHVHLDSFPNGEVSQILERAKTVGVRFVISAGTTLESSRRSIELSTTFPECFSGVGIHPMDIQQPVDEITYDRLSKLATHSEKVLVISEIGLDFMKGAPDRAIQYQGFREQIRLARELKLPIVFHSRGSHDEVFRLLREERAYEVGGAMHYFQADEGTANKAIDLGFYISLARPLLRLPNLEKVAAELPLEYVVLESDTAPQPFKAKRQNWTEPRHVRAVAKRLAELQRKSVQEVEAITTSNARKLIGKRWETIERFVGDSNGKFESPLNGPKENRWQDPQRQ